MINWRTVFGTAALLSGVASYYGSQSSAPRVEDSISRATTGVASDTEALSPEPSTAKPKEINKDVPVVAALSPRYVTEPELMTKLRDLGDSDPELSIRLVREGDARYPGSSDAAERGWRMAKSLVNLRRFREARDYARIVVEQFPGTSWANDLERHLLVNPLDYPAREEMEP